VLRFAGNAGLIWHALLKFSMRLLLKTSVLSPYFGSFRVEEVFIVGLEMKLQEL